ncbi:MAG: hemolysin family protein [Actinomycetes bacterium]
MPDVVALLLAVALLGGNAFFVGAEFALVSTRREQLEPLAAAGGRRARTALRATSELSLMMSGAQLGITVCSLGLGAVGEPAVAHLLEGPFAAAGVPDALVHPVAFALALTVVVALHMVLGEMVPKNIALAGPVRSALLLGPALYRVVHALRPLIALLNGISNLVLRHVVRVEPRDEAAASFAADEVADLIAESHREGLVDADQRALLLGTVGLERKRVGDVLLPSDELVVLDGAETAGDVEDLAGRTGYSRFPVRRDGRLQGYVHVKDLVVARCDRADRLPDDLVRALPRLPSSLPLARALRELQRQSAHLAAVTDDSGADLGVVALEDVLEEVVGEVGDATHRGEHDRSRAVAGPRARRTDAGGRPAPSSG